MSRRKEFEFEPIVVQKSLPEKVMPFVASSLMAFLVVGSTVMFAFGTDGLRLYLIFCGILVLIGTIFLLIKGGASIAQSATESSAKVFMQQDFVDAYTDNMRSGRAPQPRLVEPYQVPQVAQQQQQQLTSTIPQLPQPRESTLKF